MSPALHRYALIGGTWTPLDGGVAAPPPPPPPPPPPTSSMIVGSSGYSTSLSPSVRAFGSNRVYDTNSFPASIANTGCANDKAGNRWSCYSAKPDVPTLATQIANGNTASFDSSFDAFMDTIPQGNMPNGKPYNFYMNLCHEADVKINQNTYTLAQAKAALNHIHTRVRAYQTRTGKTNIIATVTTTEQPFGNGNYGYVPTDFFTQGVTQVFLVDTYNRWGMNTAATNGGTAGYNGNPWSEMSSKFAPFVAYVNNKNWRWGIGETSAYEDPNTSANQPGGLYSKNDWLVNGLQWCSDNGCEVFHWWNQNFSSDLDQNARLLVSSSSFENVWSGQLTQWNS